jgi:ribA/ribD-fused uncharacterized protein
MEILIRKVKEDSGWLSCMSAYPVMHNGIEYRTCEALFQSLRFQAYPNIQGQIQQCKSPMGAKMIARKNRALLSRGEMWDEAPSDFKLMEECLKLKLEQHPELKDKLIKTGNDTIIEDCTTHDRESARFWGMVFKGGKWIGENNLGKLWMQLRKDLLKMKNTGRVKTNKMDKENSI